MTPHLGSGAGQAIEVREYRNTNTRMLTVLTGRVRARANHGRK